ncbi:MAG: UvrB/UvrC motif-containing protein [Verrucomicrobiae bacterium]|nr:UvrB/UvrC motif-containing protein [Verrucomicrobiae bacterium]
MKCDMCKEGEATVHLMQIVDGKIQKVDLCEACAKAKRVTDPTAYSIADMVLGMGTEAAASPSRPKAERRCPSCEMTLSDFRRAARLGCPQCYEAFAEALGPMLKGMHKGLQHVGKTPLSRKKEVLLEERLRLLRQQLQAAVKAENFEAAVRLRDQIKALEGQKDSKTPPTREDPGP